MIMEGCFLCGYVKSVRFLAFPYDYRNSGICNNRYNSSDSHCRHFFHLRSKLSLLFDYYAWANPLAFSHTS